MKPGNSNKPKGIISLVILGMLILFSLIILGLSQRAGFERKMVSYTQERTQAFFVTWDGLKEVMKILREDDLKVDSYKDKWASTAISGKGEEGEWKVISLYDNERFININKCGEKILRRIFGNYPVLFDSLLDWLDQDNVAHPLGAEDDYYREKFGYACRNGELQSIYELYLLKGADDLISSLAKPEGFSAQNQLISDTRLSLLDRLLLTGIAYAPPPPGWDKPKPPPGEVIPWPIKPGPITPTPPEEPPQGPPFDPPELDPKGGGITIYHEGKININTALPQVLMALGFLPDTVKRFIWYRIYGNVFPAADANTIIQELIKADWLKPTEPLFETIVENIQQVASEGKLGINSSYFTVGFESQTKKFTPHKLYVVLKRTRSPQKEVEFEVIRWWESGRF